MAGRHACYWRAEVNFGRGGACIYALVILFLFIPSLVACGGFLEKCFEFFRLLVQLNLIVIIFFGIIH